MRIGVVLAGGASSQSSAEQLLPRVLADDVAMADAVLSKTAGLSHIGFPTARGEKPLIQETAARGRRGARTALLSAGLVTRPAGNRETAREMDRERLRRAQLELAQTK